MAETDTQQKPEKQKMEPTDFVQFMGDAMDDKALNKGLRDKYYDATVKLQKEHGKLKPEQYATEMFKLFPDLNKQIEVTGLSPMATPYDKPPGLDSAKSALFTAIPEQLGFPMLESRVRDWTEKQPPGSAARLVGGMGQEAGGFIDSLVSPAALITFGAGAAVAEGGKVAETVPKIAKGVRAVGRVMAPMFAYQQGSAAKESWDKYQKSGDKEDLGKAIGGFFNAGLGAFETGREIKRGGVYGKGKPKVDINIKEEAAPVEGVPASGLKYSPDYQARKDQNFKKNAQGRWEPKGSTGVSGDFTDERLHQMHDEAVQYYRGQPQLRAGPPIDNKPKPRQIGAGSSELMDPQEMQDISAGAGKFRSQVHEWSGKSLQELQDLQHRAHEEERRVYGHTHGETSPTVGQDPKFVQMHNDAQTKAATLDRLVEAKKRQQGHAESSRTTSEAPPGGRPMPEANRWPQMDLSGKETRQPDPRTNNPVRQIGTGEIPPERRLGEPEPRLGGQPPWEHTLELAKQLPKEELQGMVDRMRKAATEQAKKMAEEAGKDPEKLQTLQQFMAAAKDRIDQMAELADPKKKADTKFKKKAKKEPAKKTSEPPPGAPPKKVKPSLDDPMEPTLTSRAKYTEKSYAEAKSVLARAKKKGLHKVTIGGLTDDGKVAVKPMMINPQDYSVGALEDIATMLADPRIKKITWE